MYQLVHTEIAFHFKISPLEQCYQTLQHKIYSNCKRNLTVSLSTWVHISEGQIKGKFIPGDFKINYQRKPEQKAERKTIENSRKWCIKKATLKKYVTSTQKTTPLSVNSFKSVILDWLSQLEGAGITGIWWVEVGNANKHHSAMRRPASHKKELFDYPPQNVKHAKMKNSCFLWCRISPNPMFSSWSKWLLVYCPGLSDFFFFLFLTVLGNIILYRN